jgi:hypothetical protein
MGAASSKHQPAYRLYPPGGKKVSCFLEGKHDRDLKALWLGIDLPKVSASEEGPLKTIMQRCTS